VSELAIIVPTVNRSHLLAGLLESITASTETEHKTYFVIESSDSDTWRALLALGSGYVRVGEFGSYTAAANHGVASTTEPYFLIANDDVVFHPGWDTAALDAMTDPVRVVGIDQGNGRHDCFFLVDRRYVQEVGEFYHPGYTSQYVDTEFVERAQARGVWAQADGALIEHRHWTLGKSQMDDNYSRAVAVGGRDRELYEQRKQQWAVT
jgi:GT2 family glycosyltransferase